MLKLLNVSIWHNNGSCAPKTEGPLLATCTQALDQSYYAEILNWSVQYTLALPYLQQHFASEETSIFP